MMKHLLDQHSVRRVDTTRASWAVAAATWACNSRITSSGYSPSQWVLGIGIRLPHSLLSNHSHLSLQTRAATDDAFNDRIQLLSTARSAVISSQYSRQLSKAMLARSRAPTSSPVQQLYSIGDAVFYHRPGIKREWINSWRGPAVVVGMEGNNLWLQHRHAVVKAATRHCRMARSDEGVP